MTPILIIIIIVKEKILLPLPRRLKLKSKIMEKNLLNIFFIKTLNAKNNVTFRILSKIKCS